MKDRGIEVNDLGRRLAPRTGYSPAERLSDAVIHVTGVSVALIAVPVLIALTVHWRGDSAAILGIVIYGVSLIAMLGFSALYNMIGDAGWKPILRRLDHSAIYCKIAGTYTPFTLMSGGHGGPLLAGIWAAALAGTGLKLVSPERFRRAGLALYLAMGWVGVAAGGAVFGTLSTPVMVLIVTGGLLYTLGVVFFLSDRLPFHYTIWHGFVLVASAVFFAAVTAHVAAA